MTLASPYVPDRRPIIVYSAVAGALVIRESAPPAPAIELVHLISRGLANLTLLIICAAVPALLILGLAVCLGVYK